MNKFSAGLSLFALTATLAVAAPAFAAPAMTDQFGMGRNSGIDCALPENANDPQCQFPGKHRHAQNGTGNPGNGGNEANTGQGNGGQGNGGNNGQGHNSQGDNGNGNNNNGQGNNGQANNGQGNNGQGNGGFNNMPHPQGGFRFSSNDRNRFHQNFGFSFGNFATPGFSITLGVAVPHSYTDLRPVPRKIYRVYPQFRGYLYFVSKRGDFVIVSPRSHKVIAVI